MLRIHVDHLHLPYPFLPFARAVSQAAGGMKKEKQILPNIIKDITQSDTIASIVGGIVNERHHSIILDERENELLTNLEYAVSGYIPVFVFYGYDLFDTHSKDLTLLLISGQLDEDFPFLREAQYIFLCESEEMPAAYQRIDYMEHIDILLSAPQPSNMQEIITEIAPLLNFSSDAREKLFYLAGGCLSSMEILLRHLTEKGRAVFEHGDLETVDAIIEERLSQMGEYGTELEMLLSLAANIGSTFSIPLLRKASGAPSCDKILKDSDKEYLTKCEQDTGKFAIQEIWNFFYSHPDPEKRREISSLLERAVYHFDPYDYLSRGHYLEQAEQFCDACELYFFAYNTIYLENITPENGLTDKIGTLSAKCGLTSYWDALLHVYKSMRKLEYEMCLETLENMERPQTIRLLLLKEYLEGLCLHRLGSTRDHHESARSTIQSAAEQAKTVEEGLWCDCQMALLSFVVNQDGNINTAQQICRELTYYYTQKSFAPFAQKGLHALERKWSALYSVERAVVKSENSVRYFRNSAYPSQYLMALNNHAANLIVLGRYSEAQEYLNEAATALKFFPSIHINRMYLLNNYCLCAVLSGRVTPTEACLALLQIVENSVYGDWMFIFKLNYSIYLALDGKLQEAEKSLRDLEEKSRAACDDYYTFYVSANLAAVLYLQNKRSKAIQLLRENCMQAPALCKATEKMYIEERTTQWVSAMNSIEISDPKIFDTYLLGLRPQQTQWNFTGRGFLYSDIQFWSEP